MLKQISKKAVYSVKKNSPVILTGVAIVGVASTAILAVKATPRALEIINKLDDQDKKTIVLATWKEYIPSILVGSVTVACMLGSGRILNRRNAAIAGLYTISEGALKDYQEKVISTIGEKKNRAIRDEINQDAVNKSQPKDGNVIITGNGDVLILELLSGRYFESTIEEVRKNMNDFNHDLFTDMELSINDWYDRLGLPHTLIGGDIGWSVDKLMDLDFSATVTDDGRPCIVLEYNVMPSSRFR